MIRVSDFIFEWLAEYGLKHVFTVPGGAAMHLNDSAGNTKGIQVIANLHEQASAISAEGYARITGGLGCCMVTAGPGGTNAITGLAGAYLDSTPVLFLSGQVKRADLKGERGVRQYGVQEFDIVSIVKPLVKFAITIVQPEDIKLILEKAVNIATTGRKGPVWLDIPLDVQGAMIDPDKLKGYHVEKKSKQIDLSEEVDKLAKLLNQAERPLLLVGNGVRLSDAIDEFRHLIEQLNIPIQTTWLGMDLIESNHPLFAERPGGMAPRVANFTLQNCDLLIIIGARLDLGMVGYSYKNIAREARKVVVDIDISEINKMDFDIDLKLECNAKDFINSILKSKISWNTNSDWLTKIKNWKLKYPLITEDQLDKNSILSAYNFSRTLSNCLSHDDIIAPGSSGFACEIFLLCYQNKKGQRIYHNRGTGSMGFGLPSAIGACIASNKKRTICVDGDGGLQMNIQELQTIITYNLPIKIFIINNGGYASIRSSQIGYFGRKVVADNESGLGIPNLEELAKAYNFKTYIIDNPNTLIQDINEAISYEGPVFCEVRVRNDEPRIPRLASLKKEDGTMVSRPLEDLYPFLDREEFHSQMIIKSINE
jgi:acetolactate synthase-1/2/3 large subunit